MVSQGSSRSTSRVTENRMNTRYFSRSVPRCLLFKKRRERAPSEPTVPPNSGPFMAEVIAQLEKQLKSERKELAYARLKVQVVGRAASPAARWPIWSGQRKIEQPATRVPWTKRRGSPSDEVQAESEQEPAAPPPATSGYKRRAPHPGPPSLPAHLPRVEKVVACAPSQCVCNCCGGEATVIGYEISEALDVKSAEYFVELTKREKRACKKCEEQGVAAAPLAARIIDKSLVSDRVIIDTLVRNLPTAGHCIDRVRF